MKKIALLECLLLANILLTAQTNQSIIFPFNQKKTTLIRTAGGYNFDNDEFLDVVAIAADVDAQGTPSRGTSYLVLLEESKAADFNLNWKFTRPQGMYGDFTDLAITDLDGDKAPEICALLNISHYTTPDNPGWLYIFELTAATVPDTPLVVNTSGDLSTRPRPNYLTVADLNGDERQELIISTGSPSRSILIMGTPAELNRENLQFIDQFARLGPSFGISPFRALPVELDTLPGAEILVAGGKNSFEMKTYHLEKGSQPLHEITIPVDRNSIILPKIQAGDLDGDGFSEILLPLKNGGAYLVYLESDQLNYRLLFPKSIDLTSPLMIDLNNNGLADILTHTEDINGITRYEYDLTQAVADFEAYQILEYHNPNLKEMQYLAIRPVYTHALQFTGAVVIPFINPHYERHGLCYWQLESLKPLSADQEFVAEILKEVDDALSEKDTLPTPTETALTELDSIVDEFSALEGAEVPLAPLPAEQGVTVSTGPINRRPKPDAVVNPQEVFKYQIGIPGLALDKLQDLNFNIVSPDNMNFDLPNKTFIWIPQQEQLGLHAVKGSFFWQDNHVSQTFTVYVNDPPKILNDLPQRDIIQIGETFRCQFEVEDNNDDVILTYTLVDYPTGATINTQGTLTWRPSYDQVDWHDFVIKITDGFDDVMVKFSLFVNHPVTIQSSAPDLTAIGQLYTYNPQIKDKNQGAYLARYNPAPKITNRHNTGIYEVKITEEHVRSNLDKYVARFKEQYLGKPIAAPLIDILQAEGKLILIFRQETKKNSAPQELLVKFFSLLNMSVPHHSAPVARYFYQYNLIEAPQGMHMNPLGRINWSPGSNQFDFQPLAYTVSDGYFSAEEHAQIYVNAPPSIVSTPDTNVQAGRLWKYEVQVTDLNTDSKITYELLEAPPDMVVSPGGIVSWEPTVENLNEHPFSIRISDGMATDTQEAMLFVNMRPQITSVPKPVALTDLDYEYRLEATDPNGDALTYKAHNLPDGAEFNPETGLLTWEPDKDQKGVTRITLEVVDAHGWSTTQEVEIHVFYNPASRRRTIFTSTASLLALLAIIYFVAVKQGVI